MNVNSPPTLSALAKTVCDMSNISYNHIPELQANNQPTANIEAAAADIQLSQTSNVSLNIDDTDLLSSEDKQLTLELFNELSSSPPKANTNIQCADHAAADVTCEGSSGMTNSNMSSPMVVPVTMYWNTFPALLLDGIKYVRLIDISRQALPSKETGVYYYHIHVYFIYNFDN